MSGYISRDAAIEAVREEFGCETCNGSNVGTICTFCNVGEAIRRIKNIPAADAEPVRHGRWGQKQGGFWEFAACSLCGEKTPTVGIMPNYCPSCGARMTAPEARADG